MEIGKNKADRRSGCLVERDRSVGTSVGTP
jgi:hypothetical protein